MHDKSLKFYATYMTMLVQKQALKLQDAMLTYKGKFKYQRVDDDNLLETV